MKPRNFDTLKQENPNTLLLFKIGDFYELFADDAKTAAQVLGLALTTRTKKGEPDLPMAGFPYRYVDAYIRKLVSAGFRVATLEQVE